ncbi:MAG: hypothetical protein V1926_04355 [Candidatus Peregrinibacteria bacterium]
MGLLRSGDWILLCATILLLILQAWSPLWRGHLQPDVGTFFDRATFFQTHGTWQGMSYNEYQPGALWFFALLGWLSLARGSFDAFLSTVVFANVALIIGHFFFFRHYGSRVAPIIFTLLVLSMGPILLFRFELFVSLILLMVWRLFQRGDDRAAAAVLGFATSVKVYPVILLPLLVAESLRLRLFKKATMTVLFFGLGLMLPVAFMIAFGGSLSEIIQGVRVHNLKPISLDGVWGTIITIAQAVARIPFQKTFGSGIHGLASNLPLLPSSVLNFIWMVPTGLTILFIFWQKRSRGYTDPGLAYLVLLTFLFFSKVLNPQYLWWFVVFLPWIPSPWHGPKSRWVVVVLAMLSLALTQIYYPMHYTQFLAWFDGTYPSPLLFIIVVLRNILLLVLLIFACVGYRRSCGHQVTLRKVLKRTGAKGE